jgi:hypothetical protein
MPISGADNTDFITQNDQCTGKILPPSDHCTLQVIFSPHTLGSKSATLSISSNDPGTPTQDVPLGGSSGAINPDINGSYCFIRFLADGSGLEKYLDIFRKFRDVFLLESRVGRMLVEIYYQQSPSLVHFTARHDSLREATRWGLVPLAAFAYFALHTSSGEKAFLLALMNGGMIACLIIRRYTKFRKFFTPLSTRRNAII